MLRTGPRLLTTIYQVETSYHRLRLLPQVATPFFSTATPHFTTVTPLFTTPTIRYPTINTLSPVLSSFARSNGGLGSFSSHVLTRTLFKSSSDKSKEVGEKDKKGVVAKFKQMFKDYWYVLIPVHVATSLVWYGGFFVMCKSGLDVVAILDCLGTSEKILNPLRSSDVGYYALAYACYKMATPLRYTVTVAGTGYTVKVLKDKGILTASEVKEQIKDTAVDVKDKYEDVKEKFDDQKEKVYRSVNKLRIRYKETSSDLKEKYGDRLEEAKEKLDDGKDKVKESVHKFRKK